MMVERAEQGRGRQTGQSGLPLLSPPVRTHTYTHTPQWRSRLFPPPALQTPRHFLLRQDIFEQGQSKKRATNVFSLCPSRGQMATMACRRSLQHSGLHPTLQIPHTDIHTRHTWRLGLDYNTSPGVTKSRLHIQLCLHN